MSDYTTLVDATLTTCPWLEYADLDNLIIYSKTNHKRIQQTTLPLIPLHLGPHLILWFNFNSTMCKKVSDEITYLFPNFNGATAEVWESISNFTLHYIMDVIIYPCWN